MIIPPANPDLAGSVLVEDSEKTGGTEPPPDIYQYDSESTLASDVMESDIDINKNDNDGYLPEKPIPATGGEELSQNDHHILAAPEYDTSLEEKLDIPILAEEEALISLENALASLTPEVLKALDEKFRGSIIQIRHVDERDQIF